MDEVNTACYIKNNNIHMWFKNVYFFLKNINHFKNNVCKYLKTYNYRYVHFLKTFITHFAKGAILVLEFRNITLNSTYIKKNIMINHDMWLNKLKYILF